MPRKKLFGRLGWTNERELVAATLRAEKLAKELFKDVTPENPVPKVLPGKKPRNRGSRVRDAARSR